MVTRRWWNGGVVERLVSQLGRAWSCPAGMKPAERLASVVICPTRHRRPQRKPRASPLVAMIVRAISNPARVVPIVSNFPACVDVQCSPPLRAWQLLRPLTSAPLSLPVSCAASTHRSGPCASLLGVSKNRPGRSSASACVYGREEATEEEGRTDAAARLTLSRRHFVDR